MIYPVFMWLTALTSKRWQPLEKAKNDEFDVAGGRFAEAIGQIRVVKSFVRRAARARRTSTDRYAQTVGMTVGQSRWWHLHGRRPPRRPQPHLLRHLRDHLHLRRRPGRSPSASMVLLIQLVAMAKQPVR